LNLHPQFIIPFERLKKRCDVPHHAVAASFTAEATVKFQVWQAQAMLNAASRGLLADVQHLLDRGCPVDVCDYDRRTGLMLAAANGHEVSTYVLHH
jgi:ankyrin repeat protein